MPWERYQPPTVGKGGSPMRDKVSVRKDGFSISNNLYEEHLCDPNRPLIEIFVNKDTQEIGFRASEYGHKPRQRKDTTCAIVYAKGIMATWKPIPGRYPARYDPDADLVVFKPKLTGNIEQRENPLEEQPGRKVCPQGLEKPLEDPDICRSRCEGFYKRRYGDNPESCRWNGWEEGV